MTPKEQSELISLVNRGLKKEGGFIIVSFREFTTMWNLIKKQAVHCNWAIKTNPEEETVTVTQLRETEN